MLTVVCRLFAIVTAGHAARICQRDPAATVVKNAKTVELLGPDAITTGDPMRTLSSRRRGSVDFC